MPMDSNEVLERAIRLGWSSFKGSWALLVVAALALVAGGVPGAVLGQVAQGVAGIVRISGGPPEAVGIIVVAGTFVAQLVGFCAQWPTMAGAGVAAVRAQRGHANDFKSLLSGFKRFGSVMVAQFVLVIVQFLVWIPAAASSFGAFKGMLTGASTVPDFAQLNIGALIACGLVATIVNIWIYARFGQAALRAADPDEPRIGGIAALRYSFALTRGHTLSAIGIAIVIGTAAVLGVLLCCVGLLLVGMPLGLSLQAGFYRALRNEPDPQPAAPLPSWPGAVPPQTPV
jgi:hypothetical protein